MIAKNRIGKWASVVAGILAVVDFIELAMDAIDIKFAVLMVTASVAIAIGATILISSGETQTTSVARSSPTPA